MFYSGQSLRDGKDQSLSAKVRELWHNIPVYHMHGFVKFTYVHKLSFLGAFSLSDGTQANLSAKARPDKVNYLILRQKLMRG